MKENISSPAKVSHSEASEHLEKLSSFALENENLDMLHHVNMCQVTLESIRWKKVDQMKQSCMRDFFTFSSIC